jgi:hypothetical protein
MTPRPVVDIALEGLADAPMECLLDTGSLRTRMSVELSGVDISLPINGFVHCTATVVLGAVSDRAPISLTGRTCTVCLSLELPGT